MFFSFAQTRHSVKFAKAQPLNNGAAGFIINKSELGEGITQLTVFNEEKQPVCERLYFKKPANFLQVKLNNFQQDYQPRKKVNISVTTSDTNGQIRRRYVCRCLPYRFTAACTGNKPA